MTDDELRAIEARLEAARDEISALCRGPKRWTMSIPVRHDYDSDIILSASLKDVVALLAEVRRLNAAGVL